MTTLDNNILTSCPLETIEQLAKVLQDIQMYNNLGSYSDMYKCEKTGSDALLDLSILADAMYIEKLK